MASLAKKTKARRKKKKAKQIKSRQKRVVQRMKKDADTDGVVVIS